MRHNVPVIKRIVALAVAAAVLTIVGGGVKMIVRARQGKTVSLSLDEWPEVRVKAPVDVATTTN